MKKEDSLIFLITNLARFVFEDNEFTQFVYLLAEKLYNRLRLFVEEKLEFLETRIILYGTDTVVEAQLARCRELDAVVTDLYIDNLVITT